VKQYTRRAGEEAVEQGVCRMHVIVSLLFGCAMYVGTTLSADGSSESDARRIDEILTRLESRSEGLKDIRCTVRFIEDDRLNLVKRIKRGTILFLITEPNPKFMIHFDRTEADGVMGKREWYLFDGEWLYQALERIKQVTRQQIVKPGDKIDLFDLENAPFPLPFGQKKDVILRHFDVTLADPRESDPPGTDHLICIPKPESRLHRRYGRLEFFVRRDLHLPSRIVTTRNEGLEVNTADFPDLSEKSINAGVSVNELAKPEVWKQEKYEEVVEALVDSSDRSD